MITRNERRRTVVLMAKTAFAVLLILWLVNPAGAQESPEYWPTEGWRSSSPEEQGIDSAVLAAAINILYEQDSSNIHSLLVIRNGYVVTDAYFYP
ncbi:MAG: hypothetical protein HY866_14575 [Chloroflexi bacterium]|nr:hypothetical protein [Chloroflexota bacterium]